MVFSPLTAILKIIEEKDLEQHNQNFGLEIDGALINHMNCPPPDDHTIPCIRLARGKFELTNQDSVGGKNSSVLT